MLIGHRARHGAAPGQRRLDRLRDRAPSRDPERAAAGRMPHARPRRVRRGVDAGGGQRRHRGRGRGRRAHQQRRLQPVRRGRERPAARRPPPVRDQRVRPRGPHPARAPRDARAALRQGGQPQLDGRPAHLPRRRALPRHQVRGRGDLRRAALRGARLRRRRDPHRARSHRHPLRRDGGWVSGPGGRRTGPLRRVQRQRGQADRGRLQRDRWPSSAGRRNAWPT